MIRACNRIIEYSFYALFLLVPLAFRSDTSELFELNKMWLVWGLTIIISTSWLIKMVLQRRILFRRTPLDIPIGLFLVSQIVSTIFSLDPHTSLWGYYSRFNGGLLSIISYILLYYAFLSNFAPREKHEKNVREFREKIGDFSEINTTKMAKRLLYISLISGTAVGLWGLPSHFGYDPTCLIFRGKLDVSCWTAEFLPKVRIFSTLGQPDWLAAYLAILIPISIVYYLKKRNSLIINHLSLILIILFYVDLLYTRARSGFLGILISLIFFVVLYYFLNGKPKIFISTEKLKSPITVLLFSFLILTFIIGTPIGQLNKFTLEGIRGLFQKIQTSQNPTAAPALPTAQSVNNGGTESANIRLNVWTGAITAWKNNPIFGTGVETFAFAYYKYKPAAQNLTSEWDFLYNKAHNEYLNYLATTGIVGLGAYLSMIFVFLWIVLAKITNSFANFAKKFENVREKQEYKSPKNNVLTLALLSGYVSILVTNFFGFSVVITNIYLFMIPAFVFVLTGILPENESRIPTSLKFQETSKNYESSNLYQWTGIFFIILASLFMILGLFRFWQADIAYALGNNLDRAGEYQQAYPSLHKAVMLRGDEPVFKDELSVNDALLAVELVSQKPSGQSSKDQAFSAASALAQEAINTSNEVISQHSNNAVFWKTRVRLFYALSQVDSRYLPRALDAIGKASLIAPNDAKILYNLGVLYGQNNNLEKGISVLEKTIKLKPDYREAHYALGLFYHQKGENQKAIAQMQYILEHISPKDAYALKSIEDWSK